MSGLLATVPVEVRWSDLDSFGHVNNARYLTYFEEARLHWLERLAEPWVSAQLAPLLAAVQINFRQPLGWPVAIHVELYCERIGNSSLTFGHRIVDKDATVYADGTSVMVWTNRESGRPISVPAFVRAAAQA